MKHATRLFCATTAAQVNINEFSINLLLLQLCMHTPPTEYIVKQKGTILIAYIILRYLFNF